MMTARPNLVREVDGVFDFIERPYRPVKFHELIVGPNDMRKKILRLMDRKIENRRAGKEAHILEKINPIVDAEIRALSRRNERLRRLRLSGVRHERAAGRVEPSERFEERRENVRDKNRPDFRRRGEGRFEAHEGGPFGVDEKRKALDDYRIGRMSSFSPRKFSSPFRKR